ncbi:MAG: hypothetical protein MUD12_06685 [Spirochaetes bacterium]|jgi:hypothetical protein|nr:hypothetical protein [Spirochaetota bacterium]
MNNFFAFAALLIILAAAGPHAEGGPAKWRVFRGAWFEIKYPPGFTARPSIKSPSAENGFDSAFFTSGDGTVEFYVYSPQWNGSPTDILPDPSTEKVVSSKTVKSGDGKTVMTAIRAADGSHVRYINDTEDAGSNTRLVFGLKCRDDAACGKFRRGYERFRKSLVRFGD